MPDSKTAISIIIGSFPVPMAWREGLLIMLSLVYPNMVNGPWLTAQ